MKILIYNFEYFRFAKEIFILLILCANSVQGQLNISLSSSPSFCENNGSIIVRVTGGNGPFSYNLTGPNNTDITNISNEDNFTWSSLLSGEYNVSVSNESASSNKSIVVGGNYIALSLEMEIEQLVQCHLSSDGIITAQASQGKSDYQYDLYLGKYEENPIFLQSQINNGRFTDLEAGIYSIGVIDDCNNQIFQTRILQEEYFPMSGFVTSQKMDCSSVLYKVNPLAGRTPYQIRVKSPANLETGFNTKTEFLFDPIPEEIVTFEIMDSCNQTIELTKGPLDYFLLSQVSNLTCDGFDLSISSVGLISPITYEYESADGTMISSTSPPIIENAEYNTLYDFKAIDSCGIEISTVRLQRIFRQFVFVSVTQGLCDINSAQVRVGTDYPLIAPIEWEMIESPDTYSGDSVFISFDSGDFFYINSIASGSLGVGDYLLGVHDNCGARDTINFEVSENEIIDLSTDSKVVQECGGFSTIEYIIKSDSSLTVDPTISLFSIESQQIIDGPLFEDTAQFVNVLPGKYLLEFMSCNNISGFVSDTLELTDTPLPFISKAVAINCDDNDSLAIVVYGDSGVPEYEYRLFAGPENDIIYPTEWKTSPLIGEFPLGENYKVQIKDRCGGISSQDVSEISNLIPEIVQLDFKCEFDTIIFAVKEPILGVNYNWILPNDSLASGTQVLYPSSLAEGNLFLEIEVSTCAKANTEYVWDGKCLSTVPVEWLSFDIRGTEEAALLYWSTSNEFSNEFFLIEHLLADNSWHPIGQVVGSGSTYGIQNYEYLHHDLNPGLNYYRIKQVDYNGNFSYSALKSYFKIVSSQIEVYPNPVYDILNVQFLNVQFLNEHELEATNIFLSNLNGIRYPLNTYNIEGSYEFHFDLFSMPKGVYILNIESNNISIQKKLIKF